MKMIGEALILVLNLPPDLYRRGQVMGVKLHG